MISLVTLKLNDGMVDMVVFNKLTKACERLYSKGIGNFSTRSNLEVKKDGPKILIPQVNQSEKFIA